MLPDVDKGARAVRFRGCQSNLAGRVMDWWARQCMKMTTSLDLRFTTPRRVQYRDDRTPPTGASCNEIAGKAMIDE